MNQEPSYAKLLDTVREAGGDVETMTAFAALVAAAEREACAKIAGKLWQSFKDTKDAHERNSMDAFMGSRFGFEQSTIQQSKQIMEAIKQRGETK